jgi:hypothetical protein
MMKAIDTEGGMGGSRRAIRPAIPHAKQAAALTLALAACGGAAGNGGNGPAATVSPLVGLWHQTSAPCATGTPAPAPVEELEFEAGGLFLVTFVPFETYHDYWGPYRFDPASGALMMHAETGNAIPANLDLEGRASFAPNGELVIEGMFFGRHSNAGTERRDCTLRFTRRR